MSHAHKLNESEKTRFLGVFNLRPRWRLSLRGWLLALAAFAAGGFLFVRTVQPFLAVNEPLETKVVVIEGWVPEYAIAHVAAEMKAGRYERALVVGGPVPGIPQPAANDDTYAYVAGKRLLRMGIEPGRVEMVATTTVRRDRTYHSAANLKTYLQSHGMPSGRVNIVTLGAHARRTRYLFRQALGSDYEVGIVAVPNQEYEAGHWWQYSEGVKEIVSEGSAFIYARFFFDPK